MTDEECATDLAAAEEDLSDDYAAGRLSATEVSAFDTMFLTSLRRIEAVRFSKLLNNYLNNHREAALAPARQLRVWQRIAVVSCCLVLTLAATTAWYFVRARKLTAELQTARSAAQAASNAVPAQAPQANSPGQTSSSVENEHEVTVRHDHTEVALLLTPGLTRGTEQTPPTAQLDSHTKTLRLTMKVPENNYAALGAEVQNANGDKAWVGRPVAVRHINGQLIIELRINSTLLTSGEYIAKVSAIQTKDGSADGKVHRGSTYEEVGSFVFLVRHSRN